MKEWFNIHNSLSVILHINTIKNKKTLISPTDKNTPQIRNIGKLSQLIKSIYENPEQLQQPYSELAQFGCNHNVFHN